MIVRRLLETVWFWQPAPYRIVVERDIVEILCHLLLVDCHVAIYEVMRDERILMDERAERVDLELVKRAICVRAEAVKIDEKRRIVFLEHGARDRNLCPCRICMAPEDGPPSRVERVERLVAFFQPFLERLLVDITVRTVRLFMSILVVRLPTDDTWMTTIPLRHLAGDSFTVFAVDRAVDGIVTTSSEADTHPVFRHRKDVRMLFDKPRGRCRRRRAEHDVKVFAEGFDDLIPK